MTPPNESVNVVRWLRVPAALYLENLRRLDDLVHELRIIRAGITNAGDKTASLVNEILSAYPENRDEGERQAQEAVDAGAELVDITVSVAPGAAGDASRLLELLEQADELCRREELLTLAAPPEIAHLRRWVCEEISRQLEHGENPSPFSFPTSE